MSAVWVEGYSAEEPVPDEDWTDEIGYWLRELWSCRAAEHNTNGWFADEAGSDKCRALGHTELDFEDEDTHPYGWDGEPLCAATKQGQACTECESDDCPVLRRRAECPKLWDLVSA